MSSLEDLTSGGNTDCHQAMTETKKRVLAIGVFILCGVTLLTDAHPNLGVLAAWTGLLIAGLWIWPFNKTQTKAIVQGATTKTRVIVSLALRALSPSIGVGVAIYAIASFNGRDSQRALNSGLSATVLTMILHFCISAARWNSSASQKTNIVGNSKKRTTEFGDCLGVVHDESFQPLMFQYPKALLGDDNACKLDIATSAVAGRLTSKGFAKVERLVRLGETLTARTPEGKTFLLDATPREKALVMATHDHCSYVFFVRLSGDDAPPHWSETDIQILGDDPDARGKRVGLSSVQVTAIDAPVSGGRTSCIASILKLELACSSHT